MSAGGMPPPPPSWTPLPAAPHMDMYSMAAHWFRVIGFVLLFVGTLLVVSAASANGSLYGSSPSCSGSCALTFNGNAATAILIAKILWTLGLGGVMAGAGIKLHWGLKWPSNASTDQVNWMLAERRSNHRLFAIGLILLFLLLAWVNTLPIIPTGVP